jgi:peptidoglycan/LPS O-acetylase OafA/YrhL
MIDSTFPSDARRGDTSAPNNRLANVQALRALAALLVVFVHLKVLGSQIGIAPATLDFGNAGVDLFFVISGFIMVVTTRRSSTSPGHFVANRIARIVPFYWLITGVVFLIALVAPSLMQSTRADWSDLLLSLSFVPFKDQAGAYEPVVFVGWTLNYEMAFYAVFAACMFIKPRWLGAMSAAALLFFAAAVGAVLQPTGTVADFYTAPIVAEFALGIVLGLWLPLVPSERAWRIPAMASAAFACALLIMGSVMLPGVDRLFVAGLPAAALLGSALVLERTGIVASWGLVQRLGDASYSIYLTHFFVTQAVTKVALFVGLTTLWAVGAAAAGTFVAVAVVGLLTHRLIERPLTDRARLLLAPRRSLHQPDVGIAGRRPPGLPPVIIAN